MPLTDTHVSNSYCKRGKRLSQRQLDEYDRVERLINEVQCDLVNGVLRSDIFRKFNDGLYENLGEKKIGERQIQNYIKAAWEKMKEDRVDKVNELRDMLFSQYMALYNDAVQIGNTLAAKSCLDSIAKIFLPNRPDTAIQINSDKEGCVTVNFGFKSDENVSDSQ